MRHCPSNCSSNRYGRRHCSSRQRPREQLGNYETALSLVDDIVERFGEQRDPGSATDRLSAPSSKRGTLSGAQQKDAKIAIAAYDEVIRRCGKSEVSGAICLDCHCASESRVYAR